jgi:hypothetical protein
MTSALKMGAVCTSETLVSTYRSTRRYNAGPTSPSSCKNLGSQRTAVFGSFSECQDLRAVPFLCPKLGTAELPFTDYVPLPLVIMPRVLGLHSWLQRCLASLCNASRVPLLSVSLSANFPDSAQSRFRANEGCTSCDSQQNRNGIPDVLPLYLTTLSVA